ncbi:MAG: hypothetical protein EX271_11855 [Acidimicrobiales bacterium]|nr:hypothetical protein [Hyphomonadaceae bacterium]RZV36965.1 MAG: hypothetical protein EX271_11855 [Acidimicrobiales bacterium]
MLRRFSETKIGKDIKGAALVYVSLMMALLIGMAGVAIDMSRLSVAHTQAQAAADAAALAAARQLDGSVNSITRATAAAETAATALAANSQQFSDEADSTPNVQVTLRFLEDLPASDDTPIASSDYTTDPQEAFFAEATTEILTHDNLLLPVLGVVMSKNYTAVAIAGQDSSTCKLTQFAICNPGEVEDGNQDFDYQDWVGKLIRVKSAGMGSQWAPGNFGYLDPPSGGTGAGDIAEFLAKVEANDQCYSTGLNVRTGQVTSTRNALNTRFDIYENPHFSPPSGMGMGMSDPRVDFPPAQNVTKGWVQTSAGDPCVLEVDPNTPPTTSGFPIDDDQKLDDEDRFGSGEWDCLDYWTINHPDDPTALGPNADGLTCANNSDAVSRFEIYKWEIDNNKIPGAATSDASATPPQIAPEEGYPQCSTSAPAQTAPFDIETDRRMVRFAVMNCIAEGVQGNVDNVPPIAYMRAFLTQPIDSANAYDVYLEVVDYEEIGTNDGSLKEYVEIYR